MFTVFIEYICKYMWGILQNTFDNVNTFYIISISIVHTLAVGILGCIYLPIYLFKIPFFEKFRTNPNAQWPWQQKNWNEFKYSTIKTIILFHFILLPLFLFIDTKIGIKFRYDSESLPSRLEIISQIALAILCEDCLFFWSHYILHIPILYKYIHKKHHEYKEPYTICAEYSSPLEYLFGNVIPASFGFKILRGRAHLITVILWVFIRIWITSEAHSGYEFPFSPLRIFPMSGSADFHDFHHSKNSGAFGSFFTFWDHIMGTDKDFYKHRKQIYSQRDQDTKKLN